ncbi:MAG: DNA-processing protein DprA [Pseudomonadota bacterium]
MNKEKFFVALGILHIPLSVKSELLRLASFNAENLWGVWNEGMNVFARWKHIVAEFKEWNTVDNILSECKDKNISLVVPDSDEYPSLLKRVIDFPVLLFCKGDKKLLSVHNFSVVGTRNMTHYGFSVVNKFIPVLVEAGFCITSGMARGVDSEAHRVALRSKGKTIAVLGTGVDIKFPSESAKLYDDILSHGGLIISEFIPGTPGNKWNFPQRNRIIAGLSDGVLVVEAGKNSGSLITAGIAEGYSRDVFAVPGPVNSTVSVGVNELLKKGAVIASNPEDILDHYSILFKECGKPTRKRISDTARGILRTFGPQGFDVNELLITSGLCMGELLKSLAELEQNGYISKDNFGIYYREG